MNPRYAIANTDDIFTPALVFYKDLIRHNLRHAVEVAGSADRLRPHAKTHKTPQIAKMALEEGIRKEKCATLAEAEMLAAAGVPDVMIAYPMVGPNCNRLARLIQKYPATRFSVTADHPVAVQALSEAMTAAGQGVDVLLDIDVGMHRTGIPAGDEAAVLYQQIAKAPGLRAVGFHTYDGHNHQESLTDREAAVRQLLEPVLKLRATLEKKGLRVPRIVAGGTPTFPVFARLTDIPGLECSPGTIVLQDHGYGSKFADMAGENGFIPAALLLTRVISKPTSTRITMDLGYKAVASDPPAGKRCVLLNVPDYEPVQQSEEHFCVETPHASKFNPGDLVYAVPTHICPTCAMHQRAYVVEGGRMTGTWDIVGRDRVLSV